MVTKNSQVIIIKSTRVPHIGFVQDAHLQRIQIYFWSVKYAMQRNNYPCKKQMLASMKKILCIAINEMYMETVSFQSIII